MVDGSVSKGQPPALFICPPVRFGGQVVLYIHSAPMCSRGPFFFSLPRNVNLVRYLGISGFAIS